MKSKHFHDFFITIIRLVVVTGFLGFVKAQYISVDTNNNSASQMVARFLGSGAGCITVSNEQITGWDSNNNFSYGYFDKNSSNFAIDQGIILSTGRAAAAVGPKGNVQSFTGSGWGGDSDLEKEIKNGTINATALEFDFISKASKKISFEYMFLSEEYYPNNCKYSDGLAFFIKKAGTSDSYINFAKIPGTNRPVTVPNVNSTCPSGDPTYFGGFFGFQNPSTSPTNFNGQTKVMTATADIEVGVTYHIKIVIADEGNYQYDSAVFLKAGSFVGSKNLGPDLTMLNKKALCPGSAYTIDASLDPALEGTSHNYTWYRDDLQILQGNYPSYVVDYQHPGLYEVEIILDGGCKLKGSLKVEQQILPTINKTVFNTLCDDDFDGNIQVYLNSYTSEIINDLSPDDGFDIRYFESPPADVLNPTETPITQLNLTSTPQTVYLWIKAGQCDAVLTPIQFGKNNNSVYDIADSAKAFDICDDKLDGSKEVMIADQSFINQLIPAGYIGSLDFYKTEAGAKEKKSADYIGNNPSITLDQGHSYQTYFVRFRQSGLCDNVAAISFNFKQPAKSTQLVDKTICRDATTDLDAGAGFSSYFWSTDVPNFTITNPTNSKITNVPVGNYWVELGSNGCVYKQAVKVLQAEEPVIDNVLIEANTVTVLVSGGSKPYQYALDHQNYQTSNRFLNVVLGKHTVYVRSADGCSVVAKDFTLINVQNVITPNNDGANDYIDYSDLVTKQDPKFEVFDRNGVMVFRGDASNQFRWDGKQNGRVLPTSSYWFILEWTENGNPVKVKMSGWILLKNRD